MSRNTPRPINITQQDRRIDSEDKLVKYIRMMLGEPLINVDVTDDQILLIIDDTIQKFSSWAYGGEQKIGFIIDTDLDIQDYILDPRVQAVTGLSIGGGLGDYALTVNSGDGITLGGGWGTIGIGYVPHITMQGEVSTLVGGGAGGFMDGSVDGTAGGVAGGPGSGMTASDRFAQAWVMRAGNEAMQTSMQRGVNYEFNSNTHILRIFEKVSGPVLVEASAEYVPNPEHDDVYSHPWVKDFALANTQLVWGKLVGKYSGSLVGGTEINYDRLISEAQSDIETLNEDLLNKYSEALGIFSS